MPSLAVARDANAAYAPTYTPIMVITGATSGIGKAMTEIFARNLQGKAHIILVARNQTTANEIIASLPKAGSTSPDHQYTYEFITCDVTSMKRIHEVTHDLLGRLPKINFLVHCAGGEDFFPRIVTEEGLDKKLAYRYYARFALSYDLLPLLRNAVKLKEKAAVISVFGAGHAPAIDLNDLGLNKHYTTVKALGQSVSYVDVMTAELARREPEIAWVHTHAGFVYTRTYTSGGVGPVFWFISTLLRPFLWLFLTTPEDCAEQMLFTMLSADKGLKRYNSGGDDIGMSGFPKAPGAGEALFDHSIKATLCDKE